MPRLVFGDAIPPPPAPGYRARQEARAASGLHATGRKLAAVDHPGHGHTCGDCAHHVVKLCAKRYHKCNLGPMTGGPASDIKVHWPGCDRWEAEGAAPC